MTLWFLIANASRARVFALNDAFTLVRELEHPASRAAELDLVSDRPGRIQHKAFRGLVGRDGARGSNVGNTAEPQTTAKETEAERFAQSLAAVVTRGFDEHACEAIVLAAPPSFLGVLRRWCPERVQKHIAASLGKDYTLLAAHILPARLHEALPELRDPLARELQRRKRRESAQWRPAGQLRGQ